MKLAGRIALVAGATRGAGRGIAIALGEAGATVYCTGRSTRAQARPRGPNPFALATRPETIEETAELVTARHGGRGIAIPVDHTDERQVIALMNRIADAHGHLDVLVNDIWGGDEHVDWGPPCWEIDPVRGVDIVDRVLRTHALTARYAMPLLEHADRGLLVEVTDGEFAGYRGQLYYDLAKQIPIRLAYDIACELEMRERRIVALAVTPGFLRSEAILESLGVTEETWRDAIAKDPHFAASETPLYVGRAVAALAADPDLTGKAGRVHTSWDLAREYGFTDADGSQPHWGEHFDAVIAAIVERGEAATEEERFLVTARYYQLHLDPARREETARMRELLRRRPEPGQG